MISVITWDACIREYFHTVDNFGNQDYPKDKYEFTWVDFYKNENLILHEAISKYSNAKILNLNNDSSTKWHLGKCINAGIKEAKGEILAICDGDIVVPRCILRIIEEEHKKCPDLCLYFRRWDEPADRHDPKKSYDLKYLRNVCIMKNPTNYAGLLSIKKENLAEVNNYEESDIFCGPGINGMELYIRLRNRGFKIQWHHERIFHPYHPHTGFSLPDRLLMRDLTLQYPWIIPYAGIEQSWVVRSHEWDLSFKANDGTVEKYLYTMPLIYHQGRKVSGSNEK